MILAASLAYLTLGQTTLRAFVANQAVQTNRIVSVRLWQGSDLDLAVTDEQNVFDYAKSRGFDASPRLYCYVGDTTKYLPHLHAVLEKPNTQALRSVVGLLGKADPKQLIGAQRGKGAFPIGEVDPATRKSIHTALTGQPDESNDPLAPDAQVGIILDPKCYIREADGTLHEFQFDPSSKATTVNASAATTKLVLPNRVERIGSELRRSLRSRPFTLGAEGKVLDVKSVVALMKSASGKAVTCDARTSDWKVFIASRTATPSTEDLVDAFLSASDLYVRKVGDTFHIAFSPDDPYALAYERELDKMKQATGKLLAELLASGRYPAELSAELFQGAAFPADRLTQSDNQRLNALLSRGNLLSNKSKFNSFANDPNRRANATIQFSVMAQLTVNTKFTSNGIAFTLP